MNEWIISRRREDLWLLFGYKFHMSEPFHLWIYTFPLGLLGYIITKSAAGWLYCKEKERLLPGWPGQSEINPDEVLVVKQMCLPRIQISFPNVDLD